MEETNNPGKQEEDVISEQLIAMKVILNDTNMKNWILAILTK
jgi:hypothetical protein